MNGKYITYHPLLNSNLELWGFRRKNQHDFIKKCSGEVVQELAFCHATNNEKFVKYYYVTFGLLFPEVHKITEKMDVIIEGGLGIGLGEFTSEKWREWRVGDNDDENVVVSVIDDISSLIQDYIVPISKRYSCIENILHDYESGKLPFFMFERVAALLYYVSGQKEKCFQYLDQYIHYVQDYEQKTEENGGYLELPFGVRRPSYSSDVYIDFKKRLENFDK